MDINDLRSLSTVLVTVAFAGVCWWAFAPSRRKRFEEDAKLPFADEFGGADSNNNDADIKSVEKDSQEKL